VSAGAWPLATAGIIKGIPTAATRIAWAEINVLRTFLIICFSMGLVRFGIGFIEESIG
jgi:hypothetical protein